MVYFQTIRVGGLNIWPDRYPRFDPTERSSHISAASADLARAIYQAAARSFRVGLGCRGARLRELSNNRSDRRLVITSLSAVQSLQLFLVLWWSPNCRLIKM